jgi:hypothetical protein
LSSLLPDGTVLTVFPSLHEPVPTDDVSQLDPDRAELTREIAPIEDVTQVVDGLRSTMTFKFITVEGEEL